MTEASEECDPIPDGCEETFLFLRRGIVAKTNPQTGIVEFNVTPAKVLKADDPNWSIPNLSQADIDAAIPNAPIED